MIDALTNDDLALLDQVTIETIVPVDPPQELRAKIFAAVRRTPQLDESIPGSHESLTIRAGEGRWVEGCPGVRSKKLSSDKARGTVTVLMVLEPHTILPAHDHHGPEDSFVVAGSCHIGSVALSTGDFHHVDGTAHHGNVVAGPEGCTLLLTMDRKDAGAA